MKKIALTLLSAFTAVAMTCGVAFAAESPTAESPTSDSPTANSPTAESPSDDGPELPEDFTPGDGARGAAESTAEAQGKDVPETSPQTGLDLNAVAGGTVALVAAAGAAAVALRRELA
ncbi:MAG: NPXTG-anchored protein [Coriobacteriia bacterium]|nr:NPXTG-anchored protein [Coriobacteriia bacterium]